MSKQNLNPINPREKTIGKNAIGPQHKMTPLTPHPASTLAQVEGAFNGGQGHPVNADTPGENPLATPTQYVKTVALQTENVPTKAGMRNRSGE